MALWGKNHRKKKKSPSNVIQINRYSTSGFNVGNNHSITRRLLRLAGLVGDGLGDFPERGVDSWLPAVPLAVDRVWKHFLKKKMIIYLFSCQDTNMHLNWWMMEIYSCETSLHLGENHDHAKRGGGHMMQTLTLCILQEEKKTLINQLAVGLTAIIDVQTKRVQSRAF